MQQHKDKGWACRRANKRPAKPFCLLHRSMTYFRHPALAGHFLCLVRRVVHDCDSRALDCDLR